MEKRKRTIAALASAAVLGVPAATAAVPVFGLAGGAVATAAIVVGGIASFLMIVPETKETLSPSQRLNPDVKASLEALETACDDIRRSEIEASLRHSGQTILAIANDPTATVADLSFVILNLESLVGIAEAWKKAEASNSGDLPIVSTINTIAEVTNNARMRRETMTARSRDSLHVELAVTRRIIDEDRKGMENGI
jgi:hypothetical protein